MTEKTKDPLRFICRTKDSASFSQVLCKNGYTLFLPNNRQEKVKPNTYYCWRSHVVSMNLPYRLTDIENKVDALFNGAEAVLNKENPTFNLSKREEA